MTLVSITESAHRTLTITLNDPDSLNAMGEAMAKEFSAAINEISSRAHQYRAIILTGAGRAFSAGGDLEMLEGKTKISGEENRLLMLKFYSSFLAIRELKVPLIAAMNGHAIGAGLCLACGCDIRIASEKAKLGFTFTRLGLHPGMGATYFVPRVVGDAAAFELLLTGKVVDASEALRLGLVSKVVPDSDVMSAAYGIAEEIAQTGPEATRQLLETLRSEKRNLQETLSREALCQAINYASDEFKEGVVATKEKRKAQF